MERMKLVENDPWLEPVAEAVSQRYQRYLNRMEQIEASYGSLKSFSKAYETLGFNYDKLRKGWWYREWAPAATQLYLFGDFNGWNRDSHPMHNNGRGIWELFIEDDASGKNLLRHESQLKVRVIASNGDNDRIPVFIKRVVQDENTKDYSGQFWEPEHGYSWRAESFVPSENPLLIYESHVGMAQEEARVGSYSEFKEKIIPRIKKLGYNAIQLMAVAEHPYYGSFGYHVSNFFAASSRFGTPEELKELIDHAHQEGLAVIMDIVHSHTVKNVREGINEFDGTPLYSHAGGRGEHPQWDSKLFDYGKTEVLQFLLSNVRFWLEEYHFDGFRFDGVTSMIYHHHGMGGFFSRPEQYFTDGVEFDAITYLQLANHLMKEINPHSISIAEEVSGMPGLCKPINEGGIGFDYRLGMGIPDFWIKLLKDQRDEDWNIHEMYHTMTNRHFDIKTIAYAESHDQALVGDKTIAFRLMDKEMYFFMAKNQDNLMIDRGIALHKMIRLFTILLGGEAYLNFMGNEFGHPEWIDFPREGNNWSYQHARRQWSLVEKDYLKYHWLEDFDKAMIELVKTHNIMQALPPWQLWMDEANKTIVFERNHLIFVFNWHPTASIPDFEIPLKEAGAYRVVLNTDDPAFGGFGRVDQQMQYPSYNKGGRPYLKFYNANRMGLILKKA